MERSWPDYEKDPNAEEFRKLFVGGLDSKTTPETLSDYFCKFGKVNNLEMNKDRVSGKSKGFAFLTFDCLDVIDEIQKARPHKIDEKTVETKRATPKTHMYWPTKKLYMNNFNKEEKEEDLVAEAQEVFSKYGKVKEVKFVKEKGSDKLAGYCFIEFYDEDAVDKLNLMKKVDFMGAQVSCAKAYPPSENYNYMPPPPYVQGRRYYNNRPNYGGGGDYYYDYGYPQYVTNYMPSPGRQNYRRGGGGRPFRGGRGNRY